MKAGLVIGYSISSFVHKDDYCFSFNNLYVFRFEKKDDRDNALSELLSFISKIKPKMVNHPNWFIKEVENISTYWGVFETILNMARIDFMRYCTEFEVDYIKGKVNVRFQKDDKYVKISMSPENRNANYWNKNCKINIGLSDNVIETYKKCLDACISFSWDDITNFERFDKNKMSDFLNEIFA